MERAPQRNDAGAAREKRRSALGHGIRVGGSCSGCAAGSDDTGTAA